MNENQQLIQRIIDIDKEARRMMNEAAERRTGSARAVQLKKQEVSDNFITMARKRVEVIRSTEMEYAAGQLEQGNERRRQIAERMEQQYQTNRENWVSGIVSRVTGGDDLT